jgi:hypothetical protein
MECGFEECDKPDGVSECRGLKIDPVGHLTLRRIKPITDHITAPKRSVGCWEDSEKCSLSLQKSDYVNIAAVIRRVFDACETPEERVRVQTVARALADHFASENRAFDTGSFLTNCGINGTSRAAQS